MCGCMKAALPGFVLDAFPAGSWVGFRHIFPRPLPLMLATEQQDMLRSWVPAGERAKESWASEDYTPY